jgi:hypothetical protein
MSGMILSSPRNSRQLSRLKRWCQGLIILSLPAMAGAFPDKDIRASSPLNAHREQSDYVLSLSDCTDLKEVKINGSAGERSFLPIDSIRNGEFPKSCEFVFSLEGADRYAASSTLSYVDGTSEVYSEVFTLEETRPSLGIESVAIQQVGEEQTIAVTLSAEDNVDLSYISIRATGIQASDLRRAGGVVQKAKETAFFRQFSQSPIPLLSHCPLKR